MHIEYLSPDHARIITPNLSADAYCVELGPANLIFAKTPGGFLGCGFFDLPAFERLGIPAAKITGITTIEDLFTKNVAAATPDAELRGVTPGMSGEEALIRLSSC